jgi:MFS transporter, PPP family, 3-phenylpropionic acid transporter
MAAPAGASAPLQGLWTFAALAAVYFGFIGYFNPYLPLWLKELGFGSLAIGLLTAVQSLTRVIAPYSWGWLSDHTGRRTLLMRWAASLGLASSLGLLLMPQWVSPTVGVVGVVLFLMFFNTSAMMPMAEAALAQRVTSQAGLDVNRYGRVRVWGSVGFIVTVLVFGFVFDRFGLSWFAAGTVALLGALVAVCWRLPAGADGEHTGEPAPPLAPVLERPAVRLFGWWVCSGRCRWRWRSSGSWYRAAGWCAGRCRSGWWGCAPWQHFVSAPRPRLGRASRCWSWPR